MKSAPIHKPMTRSILCLLPALMLLFLAACSLQTASKMDPTRMPAETSTVILASPLPPRASQTGMHGPLSTPQNPEPAPAVTDPGAAQPARPSPEPIDRQVERTQYHLIASLDLQDHTLTLEEHVIYLNRSSTALETLVFILEPQRLSSDFELLELFWHDGEPVQFFSLADGILSIRLRESLGPGEQVALVLAFAYGIPQIDSPFGFTERQVNLADWYAFVPALGPDGWQVRPPGQVGEHLVYDLADFKLELRFHGSGENLVVAAPVPAEVQGEIHSFYRQQARNFTLSISPDYVLLQDPNSAVRAYVFPEHAASGRSALGCVRDALGLFGMLYGDPALPLMNIVEAEFPDGMEYDGLFFLNQEYFEYPGAGAQGGLCSLSVHETAHQWWYRLVGNDPALEPWLDEALCTFSELVFYEHFHPEMVNWWWGYRVNDYKPQGWVNSTVYDFDTYRPYVNAVYLRGAGFLNALRRSVGDEEMFEFLQSYAQTYRFGQADSQGFFLLWETVTGTNPDPVLEGYFR